MMTRFFGYEHGMGIGGWLTNYKRFQVLPADRRLCLTVGDMEHFENYITERDVRYIASLGMDHIRLGFDQIVVESAPYQYRESIFALMERFIGWCRQYGVNVVLNLHKAEGNYCDLSDNVTLFSSPELRRRFVALWCEIERRFPDTEHIAFELLNEVLAVPAKGWNDLAAETISALRKINPERKIIVGPTHWNNCAYLEELRLFDDPNVIYTFHNYEPFEFTHQRGVLQPETLFYNRVLHYPSDDVSRYAGFYEVNGRQNPYSDLDRIDRRLIERVLAPAAAFRKAHPDRILWCGEFGTIRHADLVSRENWMRDMISVLRENGIPYCVWNYLSTPNDGNRFSLVDDDRREILSDTLAQIIQGNV